jgi:energy-coupling factor transporter ATP-binding protein EcfA2
MELILENIRCFAGKHIIPIKPLTVLIGENSSGKTTLLASLAAIFNPEFPNRPAFNYPPYDLGGFESIVSAGGGRLRRARYFSLGYEGSPWAGIGIVKSLATYTSIRGDTKLLEFRLTRPNAEAHIKRNKTKASYRALLRVRYNHKTDETKASLPARYIDHPHSQMYSNLLQIKGQTFDG